MAPSKEEMHLAAQQLEAWYHRAIALIHQQAEEGYQLNAELPAGHTDGHGRTSLGEVMRHDVEARVRDLFWALAERLARDASHAFTPAGAKPIEIEPERVAMRLLGRKDTHGLGHQAYAGAQITATWEFLDEKFRDTAPAMAYQQTAKTLTSAFYLSMKNGVVLRRGCPILWFSVDRDDLAWQYSQQSRLSYHSQKKTHEVFAALATVAMWAGQSALAEELQDMSKFWYMGNSQIISRELFMAGDGDQSVRVTTLLRKFEVVFSPAFGESLNIFLSEYGEQSLVA